ncbi:MAG: isochorismatase family protein [Alphaproteobacteria bacterium]|nr:isochorismatase family protein [Alphaproteobacteria bacterium]
MPELESSTVLILIDLQKAIDMPYWGRRNNPSAEANIGKLLDAWRRARQPVVHVRHDSKSSDSGYRPGQAGNDFKTDFAPLTGERVEPKRTNSAFIGTGLESYLRNAGPPAVVIAGVSTSNSVEATVRMSGNLGFRTFLAGDACWTFDKTLADGRTIPAEDVHALSLANLDGEYARVVDTAWLLANLPVRSRPMKTQHRSHHDMGGAEPFRSAQIDRAEHELSQFDKQVDALMNLLSHPSRRLVRVDELRNAIESLPPDRYDDLAYYEKWIHAIAEVLVEKDVIGEEELVLKLAELKEREQ